MLLERKSFLQMYHIRPIRMLILNAFRKAYVIHQFHSEHLFSSFHSDNVSFSYISLWHTLLYCNYRRFVSVHANTRCLLPDTRSLFSAQPCVCERMRVPAARGNVRILPSFCNRTNEEKIRTCTMFVISELNLIAINSIHIAASSSHRRRTFILLSKKKRIPE